jgi:hypothetical protein
MFEIDGPITPKQAMKVKHLTIPKEVFDAVNFLIVQKMRSSSSGSFIDLTASVKQCDILKKALELMAERNFKATPADFYDNGWFEIEPYFERAGWEVKYDKPAFNETYEAYFAFEAAIDKET